MRRDGGDEAVVVDVQQPNNKTKTQAWQDAGVFAHRLHYAAPGRNGQRLRGGFGRAMIRSLIHRLNALPAELLEAFLHCSYGIRCVAAPVPDLAHHPQR
jgi:hypothetical protein